MAEFRHLRILGIGLLRAYFYEYKASGWFLTFVLLFLCSLVSSRVTLHVCSFQLEPSLTNLSLYCMSSRT